MAAIDKLYLKNWFEFDRLVRWSICYYPQLLNYMYNWRMTYEDWDNAMKKSIKSKRQIIARNYNLLDHYRKKVGYECSYDQAKDEVEYILRLANKSDAELEDDYSCPIMTTTCNIDRNLLWICPLSEVRRYLYEQCGYKKRWEWLYKIFWKGKKEFM